MEVVSLPPPIACGATTARAERCGHRASCTVEVPNLGPRRLCGTHARFVRVHGRLPWPPAPKQPRVRRPPRVLVQPRWTAEEDAAVRAHAGEPVAVSASLLDRTRWAIYARRKTLRRHG